MSEQVAREWEPVTELRKLLAEKGEARVYIVATSCGMRSPRSTARKLRDFANSHSLPYANSVRYVELEHEEWEIEHAPRKIRTPALRVRVKSVEAFLKLWGEAVKIRSRACGCSVFYSDGQAYDVRVMSTNQITYNDKHSYSTAEAEAIYE